ncbi:MAG: SEC-C domain-containing protein, partial [Verrucomicrobiales bacterium]|nr:SEC-C domain-containing protein [Verrucomicrobiales bacterium]
MEAILIKRARECSFLRSALLELARDLPANDQALDEVLAQAVARRENEAATNLLLSALGSGRVVDARHLVEGAALLPAPGQLAAVAMHASGNVPQALIEAVVRGKMGNEREGVALLLAGVWCKKKADQPMPPGLISQARTLARRAGDNVFARLPLLALADLLQDESLSAVLNSQACSVSGLPVEHFIPSLIEPVKDSALGLVPEHPGPITHSGYTLRRAVPRIGRNDPCPCGSGKKYKKCCIEKDQERLQNSSSVAGLTVEELREHKERFLTSDELLSMRSYELARLDPLKVSAALRPILINRLHLFEENEAVVELFEKAGVPEDLAGHWDDAIENVSRASRKDLLLRLLKLRDGSDFQPESLPLRARLLLAQEAPSPELALMENAALQSLRSNDDDSILELAYALLEGSCPALGVYLARGVLPTTHYFNADVLFDALLEARDKLNLPPQDPFQTILNQRFQESMEAHRDSKELQEAHRRVQAKDRELSQLKARLADVQSELERKESEAKRAADSKPAPVLPRPPSADESLLNDLRGRITSLKNELKERHNERNELRRDLRTALADLEAVRQKSSRSTERRSEESEQVENGLFLDDEPVCLQPIRLPEFPKKFLDSLEALPQTVVRHSLALIGRLAAGDEKAFSGVKRLKANREILRQRVGADHR